MNLVKFLLIGSVLMMVLGEFGRFPFGASGGAISVTDVLLVTTLLFAAIWTVLTRFRIFFPPGFKWLVSFWVIGLISLIFSLTLFPPPEVLKGGLYLVRFILYSSTYIVAYNLVKSKIMSAEGVFDLLIITGVILTGLGFMQYFLFPNLDNPVFDLTEFGYDPHQGRLASTLLDPNFTGAYLTLTLGLFITRLGKMRLSKVILIFLLLLALILTFSRSAWLMILVFTVGYGVWLWRKLSVQQKVIAPIIFMLLIISLIFVSPRFLERVKGGLSVDETAQERLISWQNGLMIFQISPLIGIGFNNLSTAKENLNLYKPYVFEGEHSGAGIDSSLLVALATTGIIGVNIYSIWWISVVKKMWKNREPMDVVLLSLLAGLWVESQFVNSLFFPPIMLWYFLVLGARLAMIRD